MNKYINLIKDYFELVKSTLDNLDILSLEQFTDSIINVQKKGGTIYIFGNGGSGANASHFTGDLVKGVSYSSERGFKTICLNDNISSMMAYANDISYSEIFIAQLKVFLNDNDLVVGISGSGNSENIVKALEYAKSRNVKTVAICGYNGGRIKDIANIVLHADVNNMEVVEDIHLIIFHCTKTIIVNTLNKNE